MTGELLEAGYVHTLRDPARNRPASEAVPGKIGAVKPGARGPALDDQGGRIGVDRLGAEPVALGCRLWLGAPGDARRRQAPQPAKQRAVADRRGLEPGLKCRDRAQRGASLREPEFGAAGVLIVFAPRQKEFDAVGMARQLVAATSEEAGPLPLFCRAQTERQGMRRDVCGKRWWRPASSLCRAGPQI